MWLVKCNTFWKWSAQDSYSIKCQWNVERGAEHRTNVCRQSLFPVNITRVRILLFNGWKTAHFIESHIDCAKIYTNSYYARHLSRMVWRVRHWNEEIMERMIERSHILGVKCIGSVRFGFGKCYISKLCSMHGSIC